MGNADKSTSASKKGLMAHLVLEKDGLNFLGETRIALLEEIYKTGSISRAAKVVGMSYKGAWDAIDALNNLSDRPLVERSTGGKKGGGTTVTVYGLKLMGAFRDIETEYQKGLAALGAKIQELSEVQKTLKHFSVITSARNQFTGKVIRIQKGAVNSEVLLKIDDHLQLTAIIPNSGLLDLAIKKGSIVHALFQTSSVMLSTETNLKISARNQYMGKVERIEKGAINSEVTIDLGNRKTICSTISNASVKELKLKPGTAVTALIKSSNVIVGVNS